MAETRTTALIPFNGSNYSTWKIKCKMMLMKEGLWKIATGEETENNDKGQREQNLLREGIDLSNCGLSVDS